MRRVPEILLLQALACAGMNVRETALGTLGQVLRLSQKQGYIQLYLDEGEALRALLLDFKNRLTRGGADDQEKIAHLQYVDRLLAGIRAKTAEGLNSLYEGLSEREREVLRHLDSPISSTEIAKALLVSPNTVRFHMKNIYAKLGAHRRSEAVERARKMGLL